MNYTYKVKFINNSGLFITEDFFTAKSEQLAYNLAREYYPGLIVADLEYIPTHEVA